MWGEGVGIQDEESWFTAIKLSGSDRFKQSGAWYTVELNNGKTKKFQASNWVSLLQDKMFRESALAIMDDAVIKGIKLED